MYAKIVIKSHKTGDSENLNFLACWRKDQGTRYLQIITDPGGLNSLSKSARGIFNKASILRESQNYVTGLSEFFFVNLGGSSTLNNCKHVFL